MVEHAIPKIKVWSRNWFVFLLFVIAFILISSQLFTQYTAKQQSDVDVESLEILTGITQVVRALQRERGYSLGIAFQVSPDKRIRLAELYTSTDRRIAELNIQFELLAKTYHQARLLKGLNTISKLPSELEELRLLFQESGEESQSFHYHFTAYTSLIDDLYRDYQRAIFDLSPSIAYELSQQFYLLEYLELLGQERAYGARLLTMPFFDLAMYRPLLEIRAEQINFESQVAIIKRIQHNLASEKQTNIQLVIEDVTVFRQELERLGSSFGFHSSSESWWDVQTQHIDYYWQLSDDNIKRIEQIVNGLRDNYQQQFTIFVLLLILTSLLLGIYLVQPKWHSQEETQRNTLLGATGVSMIVGVFLTSMLTVSYIFYVVTCEKLKRQAGDTLYTTLMSTQGTISNIWFNEIKTDIDQWVSEPDVIKQVKALVTSSMSSGQNLNQAAQLKRQLNTFFKDKVSRSEGITFDLVMKAGSDTVTLLTDEAKWVSSFMAERNDYLESAFKGKTVLIPPVNVDLSIYEDHGFGTGITERAWLATASPILDSTGQIIAVFLMAMDAKEGFSHLTTQQSLWQSGEAYLFDRQASMLTPSRFENSLIEEGNLSPGSSSILNIVIREPRDEKAGLSEGELTVMAGRAIQGHNGMTTKAYSDYRGVPVIGAWWWDVGLGIGMTVEVDDAEVTRTSGTASKLMLIQFLFTLLLAAGLIAVIYLLQRKNIGSLLDSLSETDVQKRRAEQALTQLSTVQAELSAVVDTALNGVIVIDQSGVIKSVNPAVERLFGYRSEELIGQNVSLLMPEQYRDESGRYIQRFLKPGKKNITGRTRELKAQNKQGNVFPITLSVSEIKVGGLIGFAGFIQDITEQKEAEQELQAEKAFFKQVVDGLIEHVLVINESGQVIFANALWCKFVAECHEKLVDDGLGKSYIEILEWLKPTEFDELVESFQQLVHDGSEGFSHSSRVDVVEGYRWFEFQASCVVHRDTKLIFISHVDITQRVLSEQILENERKEITELNNVLTQTQSALEVTGIAQYWVDLKGQIIYVTDQMCQHLGYTEQELLEMTPFDFDESLDHSIDKVEVQDVISMGWFRTEAVHRHKNGNIIPVEKTVTYKPEQDGKPAFFITFVVEIIERKQAETALVKAREEAEQANKAKSTFLATMSHEIRTPLNGIVSMIDLAKHTELNSYQNELLDTADESANLLQVVIDDILDFSKIEAGKIELDPTVTDPHLLTERLVDSLLSVAHDKGVELLTYCDPHIPRVMVDDVRLKQILFNLVGNAIKFSSKLADRPGQVYLSVASVSQSQDSITLAIDITDNGIGMSEEVLSRIFKPFVQGESQITRHHGGTGLGLVITRRLVELMGGDIDVASEQDKGSTFSVKLTLPVVEISETRAELSGAGPIVLICSNDNAGTILQKYLQYAGVKPLVMDISEINHHKPTLGSLSGVVTVVIDTFGDDSCFMRCVNEIEQLQLAADFRYVLISRGQRRNMRAENSNAMRLDLNGMHYSTYINTIATVSGLVSLAPEPDRDSNDNEQTLSSVEMAPRSEFSVLLAEDNEINQKVICGQLEKLGYVAEVANNGFEALEKWRNGFYDIVLTDCHMPGMDGYTLTQQIRERELSDQHIPIIAITADAMKGAEKKCFEAGMDGYLTKPMRLGSLKSLLEKWLQKSKETKSHAKQSKVEQTVSSDTQDLVIDFKVLPELLMIDDVEQLSAFYSEYVSSTTVGENELTQAWQEGDLTAIGSVAHKLKSSARTVGANSLADCCLELEEAGKTGNDAIIQDRLAEFSTLFGQVKSALESYQG